MKRFFSCLLALVLTGLLAGCGAQSQQSSEPSATVDSPSVPGRRATADAAEAGIPLVIDADAQAILDKKAAEYNMEGVVTVMRGGKIICEYADGVEDPETYEPIDINSLFCIGSVSKQFAAAAIVLLQERGMLHVDDTLGKYYPECPYGDEVTLRQMLQMSSGIAEFYDVVYDSHNINEIPIGYLKKTVTNDETKEANRNVLQEWLFAQPLVFTPGTENVYTNSNYFLLARIVEQVSGMPYEDFMRKNFFEPLHMDNTGFIDDTMDDPELAENAEEAQTVYVGITMGLGDVISNAADMQRWMASFCNHTILSAESIAEMTADSGLGYGYGVVPDGEGGWFHSGIFTSYKAFDFVNAGRSFALFAVTNNQAAVTDDLTDLCNELVALLMV